jgi:hypothetical protein
MRHVLKKNLGFDRQQLRENQNNKDSNCSNNGMGRLDRVLPARSFPERYRNLSLGSVQLARLPFSRDVNIPSEAIALVRLQPVVPEIFNLIRRSIRVVGRNTE